jgi:hypothetical protein
VREHLNVTYRSAQKNVKIVLSAGIVEEVERTSHPRFFAARGLMRAIDES